MGFKKRKQNTQTMEIITRGTGLRLKVEANYRQ